MPSVQIPSLHAGLRALGRHPVIRQPLSSTTTLRATRNMSSEKPAPGSGSAGSSGGIAVYAAIGLGLGGVFLYMMSRPEKASQMAHKVQPAAAEIKARGEKQPTPTGQKTGFGDGKRE